MMRAPRARNVDAVDKAAHDLEIARKPLLQNVLILHAAVPEERVDGVSAVGELLPVNPAFRGAAPWTQTRDFDTKFLVGAD